MVSTVISAIIFASGFIVCPVLRQRVSKRNANGALGGSDPASALGEALAEFLRVFPGQA